MAQIMEIINAMDIDTTVKIDLSLGSREDWNQALEEANDQCILDGRWYSDEVDDDNEITCFPPTEGSEDEEEDEEEE